MVALLVELEGRGPVARRRNAHDRRQYALTLTDARRTYASEMDALLTGVEASIFAPLDREELEALNGPLRRLLVRAAASPPAGTPRAHGKR